MKFLILKLIRFYQKCISPMTSAHCRYMPTCSQYTLEAVTKFGALKGSYLGLRRFLRCNPFKKGGPDPVPEKFSFRKQK